VVPELAGDRAQDFAAETRWDRVATRVASPGVFALDELGKITLAARGDHRAVVTDDSAGMFAAAPGDALLAEEGTVIAETGYREWLAR